MSQSKLASAIALVLCVSCTKSNIFSPAKKADSATAEQASEQTGADQVAETPEVEELKLIQKAVGDEEIVHAADLKEGEEQMAIVCERNKDKRNIVLQKFCVEKVRPKSIIELQEALNVVIPPNMNQGQIGQAPIPGFAMQGHSSSLVGQFVSAINPRVILFNDQNGGDARSAQAFVAMGFVRGEQFAEIIVVNQNEDGTPAMLNDSNGQPTIKDVSLFLVGFKQACNFRDGGCNAGELLTSAVESNWVEFTLYQDEDLKNTIIDCRHCHQPEGIGTQKFGRMQELRNPWVHWMRDNRNNGTVLLDDYFAAHGTEDAYGGVPASSISASDPNELERLMDANGFTEAQIEEIEFQTQDILDEVTAQNNAQPADNTVPGESQVWEDLFQLASTGVSADGRNIIPIPYHDVKVTEPALLDKYTKQMQDFRAGLVTMEQFEDHRNAFRTDQKQRADMGFAVRAGTPPETMLIQACFQCHNGKLDQNISRSRFDVNFQNMVARPDVDAVAEINTAIERLKLGYSEERLAQEGIKFMDEKTGEVKKLHKGEHILTMPPRRFKALTDQQIDTLIDYLKAEQAKLQ
ncbi:hypothetical protein [Pseudobacteriovorax antillogorgiicola]|uniref:Cytochrome c domain-containing protein n=1 Tax=Pseudobacteriovorax antillogorgiicola TaxID=1513793 RepID=A0A1Y6CJW9_9BACT|nr:hypothetical protein [Pseudobacteriovorax antillogorgiicola]TCS46139.1 hypothetical protein EDD56_12540 [Pseudobacteriovorax antillogorgiicola]SMF69691.1 hypothetical protein SAMN06296036_12540 [Pseudobacteriovorax antillogorgiicola]